MSSDHSDLDGLPLAELVSRLRDVDTTRTPLGWPTEQAVTKAALERRIIDLVIARDCAPPEDEAHRVRCEIQVKLRAADRPSVRAASVTVHPGGVFVPTDADLPIGEPVELELDPEAG